MDTTDPAASHAVGNALQLVDLVHNYGPDAIHALIGRWDDQARRSVLVALAAAVDPDSRPSQLWGWLGPIPQPAVTVPINDVWDELALATKRREVEERRRMVGQLTTAGYTAREIATRLDVSFKVVERDRAAITRLEEAS